MQAAIAKTRANGSMDSCRDELGNDEWVSAKAHEFDEMVDFINEVEYPTVRPDSDGDTPPTCEVCKISLTSGAEIREHYKQNHPEVVRPQTGDDIREKFKSRKNIDGGANGKGKRT